MNGSVVALIDAQCAQCALQLQRCTLPRSSPQIIASPHRPSECADHGVYDPLPLPATEVTELVSANMKVNELSAGAPFSSTGRTITRSTEER